MEKAEREVNKLTERQKDIDRALFDPKNYDGPESALTATDLMKKRSEIERDLAKAEARWLDANEALENADSDAA